MTEKNENIKLGERHMHARILREWRKKAWHRNDHILFPCMSVRAFLKNRFSKIVVISLRGSWWHLRVLEKERERRKWYNCALIEIYF